MSQHTTAACRTTGLTASVPSIVCGIFRHLFLLSKGRAGHNLPVELIRDPHLMGRTPGLGWPRP